MRSLLLAGAALMLTTSANAATFTIEHAFGHQAIVRMEGEIERGDEAKAAVALASNPVLIALNSPGGYLMSALYIADMIRDMTTMVPDGATCASSCGYLWLFGHDRVLSPSGRVGFHAAFNRDTLQETGPGNAILGSHLAQLRLSDQTIGYLTTAGPTSITWLQPNSHFAPDIRFHVATEADMEPLLRRDRSPRDETLQQAFQRFDDRLAAQQPAPSPPNAEHQAQPSLGQTTPPLQPTQQVCNKVPLYGDWLDAVHAALGPSVPSLTVSPEHEPPGCMRPIGLLNYDDAEVLIVQQGTKRCYTCKATLSAFVLIQREGFRHLARALPAFAELGALGEVSGPITPVKIGADDGMVVENWTADRHGNAATTLDLFRFASGGIVHLQSESPILLSVESAALSMTGTWKLHDGEHFHIEFAIDQSGRHGIAVVDFEIRHDRLVVTSTKPFIAFQ